MMKLSNPRLPDLVDKFKTAVVEAAADAVYAIQSAPTYPPDHKAGMRVPKGGSSCSSCEYLEGTDKCNNKYFIKWNGSSTLPFPADEYCTDWYEPKNKIEAAVEHSAAPHNRGTLWNGIRIVGFTGPQEEGLRAMMSRVPPELLFNITEIVSAKELNAVHGQFKKDTKVISFNPDNFQLRQRFGKGDGWMYHPELTTVHEVGHSIFESFTDEEKEKWNALGGWQKGWSTGQSLAYVETRPGWEPGTSEWTHKAGLKLPRHYSEKNPNECFADCFAFFILGKAHQMDKSLKEFMTNLVETKVKKYPAPLVESPSKPYTGKV